MNDRRVDSGNGANEQNPAYDSLDPRQLRLARFFFGNQERVSGRARSLVSHCTGNPIARQTRTERSRWLFRSMEESATS